MLAFMLESAALRTTKFITPAAAGMPEWAKTRTKGLSATTFAPDAIQGMKLSRTVKASR